MDAKMLEDKVKKLEEIVEKQQHEIERAKAVNAISNLMCKYEYILVVGRAQEVVDMFALKQPDVRAEMKWGVYEGAEGIKKLYLGVHLELMKMGQLPGCWPILPNSNPVIEVAEDGQTAKAVWICNGMDTGTYGQPGDPKANWAWAKRAADFIKEDGVWKIWHYGVYGIFFTPFDQSWVHGDKHPPSEFPPGYQPDRPPTKPDTEYNKDQVVMDLPYVPQPYKTFDPKTAY